MPLRLLIDAIMSYSNFDSVLDTLTPNHILAPIEPDQQGFKKIIYLEEELENLTEVDPFFSNGSSEEDDKKKDGDGEESMEEQDDPNMSKPEREKALFHRRFKRGVRVFNKIENMINVSNVCYWKASSYKAMHPIENVLNDDPESYWQSDGGQPHIVDIYFNKRVEVTLLALFFGFEVDESYSPSVMKVYVGDSINDLTYYEEWHIQRITQWYARKFPSHPIKKDKSKNVETTSIYYNRNKSKNKEKNEEMKEKTLPVKCQVMRLSFPLNHDNGKDTHLRGIRIFGKDDGILPAIPNDAETQVGITDRVLANMYPKSKFNDGLLSIR